MSRRLNLRRLRLRAVWLLIIPFYVFAAPSANLLWWGAGLSAAGLSLRAWAAGSIRKDRELATTGPYAHTRNPLSARRRRQSPVEDRFVATTQSEWPWRAISGRIYSLRVHAKITLHFRPSCGSDLADPIEQYHRNSTTISRILRVRIGQSWPADGDENVKLFLRGP